LKTEERKKGAKEQNIKSFFISYLYVAYCKGLKQKIELAT
jgi:hypothetical protein